MFCVRERSWQNHKFLFSLRNKDGWIEGEIIDMIYETTWRIVIQSIGSLLLLMILIALVIEIYDRLNRYIKCVLKHKKEKEVIRWKAGKS